MQRQTDSEPEGLSWWVLLLFAIAFIVGFAAGTVATVVSFSNYGAIIEEE